MDVSIIIVNYNTLQMTAECINSVIEKTNGIEYELILVDNASNDGSKDYFGKDQRIKYIYNIENIGFGRANSLGYTISKGRYVLFLNSDTLLVNNAIKLLSDFLDNNGDISIVGGQLLNKELKPVHSYSLLFPSIKWEFNFLFNQIIVKWKEKQHKYSLESNKFVQVAYITGADMMLRRNDIEKLGLFNPDFFMYFEETELAMRYKRNGKIACFYSLPQIIHLENASFKIAERRERMFLDSREKLYNMIYPKWKHIIANSIYTLTCITRIFVFILNHEKRNYWLTRFKIFNETRTC